MSRRKFLTVLAFLAFTSLGLPDGLLGVSWPSIRSQFGLPLDRLGLLVTVTTAGYLTSSFMTGPISRIVPIGTLLAMSTLAASIGLLGFSVATNWQVMVSLGFVAGLGGGAVDAGLNSYGAKHFSPKALNWLHAFFGLGTTMGPVIVSYVLKSGGGWWVSYAVVGSAQLALATTFFFTRARWADAADIATSFTPAVETISAWRTLELPRVWLGMLVFFFYSGVEIAAAQWSYSLLSLGRGFTEGMAATVVGLYWASLMTGRVAFGFVANRLPLIETLRVCLLGSVLGALLFWLDFDTYTSVGGLLLMGFLFAPVFASLISLTPDRVGRAHADSAIGFQIAAAGLGGAVLTSVVGVLTRTLGLEVIGAALFVAALLLFFLYLGFTVRPGPAPRYDQTGCP
ncbi:MFS transporter [Rhizobium sp. Leaf384]|uniref:MFS transporter n=1 Tax=Rhizobium sp. Leaf384 TaxID=1736358 RepID=UPI0007126B23|nr:MFS transporter [Rhizobium sp. Leaf384]KQS78828.1 MFS transporter [Rhizobium sp. Leaf384]